MHYGGSIGDHPGPTLSPPCLSGQVCTGIGAVQERLTEQATHPGAWKIERCRRKRWVAFFSKDIEITR